MRKLFLTFLTYTTLLCLTTANAYEIDAEVDFEVGYREDSLNWSLGADEIPVFSKLEWKNLQMVQYRADLRGVVCDMFYFRGYGDYGKIFNGRNTDSDFAFEDSSSSSELINYLKSKQDAGKGEVFDLSFGLGYQFELMCGQITLSPLIGYSYHEQHLRMFNGEVVVNLEDDFLGPVDNLHSNYRTRWQGPWVGFDAAYQMNCDFKIFGGFEYHWAQYNATGHWNLRWDFIKDFEHTGHNAEGILATLGMSYDFWCDWTVGIVANYQTWDLQHGRDKSFVPQKLADVIYNGNSTPTSRLNEVNWHSYSVNGFLGYYF